MTSNKLRYSIILISALLFVPLFYNSCAVYNPATGKTSTLGNPKGIEKTAFAFGRYQQVSALSVCLNEMTLTSVGGGTVTVPFVPPKPISVPLGGIELDTLLVDQGQYTKISLELADACGDGASLQMTNSYGNFKTASPISLKFSGNEFLGNDQRKTVFDMLALAGSLSTVQSDAMLAANAMASTGDYHSLNCGMQSSPSSVAFCETFDKPSPILSRSGQLNSRLWNVARLGPGNAGQGEHYIWGNSTIDACGTPQQASPDGTDLIICNGQLRQSTDDIGNFTAFNISPKQAFDFSGRVGTIAFDVTNDSAGSSSAWPEFWLSDQNLPGIQTENGVRMIARNAIGLRMSATFDPFQGNIMPGCPSDGHKRWVVGTLVLVKDYAVQEIDVHSNDARFQNVGCAISSEGSGGGMNHIELRVSQNQIEVWATDAGNSVLKKISHIRNISLPFSKGYISLGDYHRNAGVGPVPSMKNHTFAWDNVAFDGPVVKRDLGFDVLNSMTPLASGAFGLGWQASPGTPANLNTIALSAADIAAAKGTASLTFNFSVWSEAVNSFQYSVNGTPLMATIPFPTQPFNQYSIELPVPVGALMSGPQNISIQANQLILIGNVTLNLPGAGE